jgi:predicted dehydrogenase
MKPRKNNLSVLLVGGFGHAVCVFDEWFKDRPPLSLAGRVQTLPDESQDTFLNHPWAKQFDPLSFDKLKDALDAVKPDFVVVSTRPDLNPEIIEQGLRAGCHVISEKPLAVDESGLSRVHAALCETGKFLLPMLGMANAPAFTEARELVGQGVIGEPALINARKSYQWGQRAEWFRDRHKYGGIWGWVGIHAFNNAAYILGRRTVKVLAAQQRNRCHPDYAPGCPDCLSGLFLLEGDVQMTVSVDLLRPDGQASWGDDWVRIVGSEGSLEANPALGTIRLIRKGRNEELRKVSAINVPFYTPFLDAVNGACDFSEIATLGLQLTDAALAAERASCESLCGLQVDPGRWKIPYDLLRRSAGSAADINHAAT